MGIRTWRSIHGLTIGSCLLYAVWRLSFLQTESGLPTCGGVSMFSLSPAPVPTFISPKVVERSLDGATTAVNFFISLLTGSLWQSG